MIATDPARDDCQLGARRVTYACLVREYRCDECGGRLVIKYDDGWCVACGCCGSSDFIHECELQRQRADAVEVLAGLPDDALGTMGIEREEREPRIFRLGCEPIVDL